MEVFFSLKWGKKERNKNKRREGTIELGQSIQKPRIAADFLFTDPCLCAGVGVGDASASPTAALLLTILQESMGRLATILFAHRLGKFAACNQKICLLTSSLTSHG